MADFIRLTDAQRRLVEDNVALVGYTMNRFGHQGLGFTEDAFQTGLIGLMRAAARYDSRRGVKFASFAVHCIRNELRRERQHQCRAQRGYGIRPTSLDEPVMIDGDFRSRVEALPSMEADIGEHVAHVDALHRLLSSLARRRTQAAKLTLEYLLTGATQAELAKRHSLSQPHVSRQISTTMRRLRQQARKQGGEYI